jgi:hypothetical protein
MHNLLARLERAADAFLKPPPAGPLKKAATAHQDVEIIEARLEEWEIDLLREHAVSLMDDDIRGYVIITVRTDATGADIECSARLPAPCLPGVTAALQAVGLTG